MLEALDPEQRQVAEALRGPVRVLAGAGTGKTRAVTHRIAHGVATGVYAPTEVLALSFTTRAAGEMRERLRALGAPGVQARTFHSAALRQLRFFWPRVHQRELPELTQSKLGMLALAARRQRLATDQATLRDLASEIEWAKVSNVSPDSYAALARARGRSVSGLEPEVVARAFAAYEEVKRDQGRMDMEDVLLFGAGLLADNEAVAAQVRRQYKWFVVDEFQDVSPLQHALLDLWLGGRDELCVVGDPAQTIYSFAGADARYLREFTQRFPSATSVELVRNYRSTPEVVAGANTLLAGTESQGVALVAQRPGGAEDHLPRGDRRGGRGRRRRRPDRRAARAGHAGQPDGGAAADQRAVRALRGGARRARPALRRTRCGAVLRPARGAAGDHPRPRCRAQRARGPDRWPTRSSRCCRRWATRSSRRRAGERSATGGSRSRPSSTSRPTSRASSPRPPSATSSTTSTAVPASSTRRSPMRSPSRPSTPPRVSSGTPSSSPACTRR